MAAGGGEEEDKRGTHHTSTSLETPQSRMKNAAVIEQKTLSDASVRSSV
jgi:hypothetical protein